jgi:hypothetical protein
VVFIIPLIAVENFDLILFSEHWETFENLALINIPEFKLASSYCRKSTYMGEVQYLLEINLISNADMVYY